MKADRKAVTVALVHARSAKVAPVTTMDSPSAMMMNPAQRSAIWPPSTVQSSIEDAPYFGIQKRAAAEIYSIPSAAAHSTSRESPSAMPPAIQNIADVDSQTRIRIAFMRTEGLPGGTDARRRRGRPDR